MLIALWLIGVERLDVDRPVRLRGRQILAYLDEPVVLGEDATDGGETHVFDGKADVGMRGIDRPAAGGYRGRRGGGGHCRLLSFDRMDLGVPSRTGKPSYGRSLGQARVRRPD